MAWASDPESVPTRCPRSAVSVRSGKPRRTTSCSEKVKYGRVTSACDRSAGVSSMPFIATSKSPRVSEGISVLQSFWTKRSRTPSRRARPCAISSSNPSSFDGSAGSR